MSIVLDATYNNQTFANEVCSKVNVTGVQQLYISGVEGVKVAIPSCLAESGPGLIAIDASRVIVEDFSYFPDQIIALTLTESTFSPVYVESGSPSTSSSPLSSSPSSSNETLDGYGPSGHIAWEEIWSYFQKLAVINWIGGDLKGSLPAHLPSTASYVFLTNHQLSGTIPSTLFNNITSAATENTSIVFRADHNQLTGSIPDSLFSGFVSHDLANVAFDFSNNGLTGSVPATLLLPLATATVHNFKMDFANNTLDGSLSDNFFPEGLLADFSSITFDLSNNSISGTIPSTLFSGLTSLNSFKFNASANKLSGSLPAKLFSAGWQVRNMTTPLFTYSVAKNNLSGTLPAGFLASSFTKNATFYRLVLELNDNQFSGSIPEQLLYALVENDFSGAMYKTSGGGITISEQSTTYHSYAAAASTVVFISASSIYSIRLDNNILTGAIPSTLFTHSVTAGAIGMGLTFNVTNNALSGSIPSDLFTSMPPKFRVFKLLASKNQLSGSPPAGCWDKTPLWLDLSYNKLDGTIPSSWQNCFLPFVSLAANQKLIGTIPPALFSTTTKMTYFNASHTSLVGNFPANVSTSLGTLDMSYSYVQFCPSSTSSLNSANSPLAHFTGTCDLYYSDACRCDASYYSMCNVSCGCPLATRPSLDFYCVDGTWTASTPVTQPTLTIAPSTGTVIVNSNVTSTTIVFSGLGSTIHINGCITNLSSVYIELDKEQVERLGKTKVLQQLLNLTNSSLNCSTSLNNVNIGSGVKNGGCKKVKVEKATTGSSTFGAYFTLDQSKCNQWWIILVSVVCALVAVGVIAAVTTGVLLKRHRHKKQHHSLANISHH